MELADVRLEVGMPGTPLEPVCDALVVNVDAAAVAIVERVVDDLEERISSRRKIVHRDLGELPAARFLPCDGHLLSPLPMSLPDILDRSLRQRPQVVGSARRTEE